MRVAVYGGSFDPPHVGHAMVCGWLLWTDRVDAVWVTPTRAHPFGKDSAPFDARVAWCRALAQSVGPGVEVCTLEQTLPAPSYTVHTLDALAARHPEHSFQWVLGADLLPST
ncbi:MAG: nicotinate-nicotinamide nucleotide adenylyltransferase, partial [Myxococcales bacterium]|nr:nicotinate-nicotinamide nucleotide adenylyltransferase [Myxococcales bacterium]